MKLRKITALVLSGTMVLSLAACGGSQKPAETKAEAAKTETQKEETQPSGAASEGFTFDHRIEIMVPAGEGGGLDTTIRKFAAYLEKELGTSIVISNRDGASGVTGFTWSHNQPSDGYKYQFTAPSAIIADAQGQCSFDLMEELVPVSGLVMAEGMFFASPEAPFTNLEEMIAYCKEHPEEVTISVDSPNGISGAIISEFCHQADIRLKWITSEPNEGTISVIAGDVDLVINTWSDAGAYVESGDLVPIVVMAQQRNDLYADVPCSGELGYESNLGYYRVFTALKGTPQEAIDAFGAAVHKVATTNEEWIAWLEGNGMGNHFVYTAEELAEVIQTTHDMAAELKK